MAVYFDIICIIFFASVVSTTWLGPRHYGVIGMLAVHVLVFAGHFAFAMIAIAAGRCEYDGILSHMGVAIQAILLNCLLLPLAIAALWRRRRFART